MHISEAIPVLRASPAESPTTAPLPSASWNAKWICLKTAHHPKLAELERAVGQFCFDLWRTPQSGRLLILAGTNGTGKTHCAKRVRDWARAVGHGRTWFPTLGERRYLDCLFWSWPKLLDALKSGEWDILPDLEAATLLIIDELGGGHDPSRVGVDKLCQLLSRREHQWTLITTNFLPDAWAQTFDQRIASRFFRNSVYIDLSDVPDFSTT